ncbi:MAG: hypothetical protein M3Y50_00095 [Acidobacteriota bacterium]|nr:hypothetical protein [Acidobacteriota bacterium]
MTPELTRDAKALLSVLVDVLPTADPEDPRTFITYSKSLQRLGILSTGHAGRTLQDRGLDALAEWAKAHATPAITGLVIREAELGPGSGYFRLYGKREPDDFPWWLEEIRKAKQFDWSPYLDAASDANQLGASQPKLGPLLTVNSIARHDSRFFLKSEYGPLSQDWPVVAFTSRSLGLKLQAAFRPEKDFIVYTGTGTDSTPDDTHRSRLLSVVRIDTASIRSTSELIADHSWDWARDEYPGQWENCFRAAEGWNFVPFPVSREILPTSYPIMGRHPNRGGILEMTATEREALLRLPIAPLKLRATGSANTVENPDLLAEARRITNLIFARVSVSGETTQHTAPERTAPENLVSNISALLQANPLVCYLCGGTMEVRPKNRLLQPSPDRIDSSLGSYGPENLKLAHLACNLGKNASSVEDFADWLSLMQNAKA